jgi:hypothetical protein
VAFVRIAAVMAPVRIRTRTVVLRTERGRSNRQGRDCPDGQDAR